MLIILDRDGVINQDSPDFIKTPDEWQAIPGSLETIAAWNRMGHDIVVATNQSGVSRGYFSLTTLMAIHRKMCLELAQFGGHFAGIYFCPHQSEHHCSCRKPKPGMLLQIARDFSIDLSTQAIMIGDSLRDIQAARAAQCPAILVTSDSEKIALAHREGVDKINDYPNLVSCHLFR